MLRLVGIFAICLLSAINVYAGEVKVHFMDYNTLEWQALESTVKSTITTQLDDYCSSNDCKITGTNVNSTVVFTGAKGTFSIDGRFAIVDISATIGSTALTSEVLEQFMIARRADIVSGSKAVIAYVNDKLVYPARDNTDNYVIISVSSTVVLGLFILNLVLTKKRNKEIKDALSNGKKNDIYSSPDNSPKKINNNKSEETVPLRQFEEEDSGVPGFPKANEEPILSTSESMYNGVRVNPNLRLTQV